MVLYASVSRYDAKRGSLRRLELIWRSHVHKIYLPTFYRVDFVTSCFRKIKTHKDSCQELTFFLSYILSWYVKVNIQS